MQGRIFPFLASSSEIIEFINQSICLQTRLTSSETSETSARSVPEGPLWLEGIIALWLERSPVAVAGSIDELGCECSALCVPTEDLNRPWPPDGVLAFPDVWAGLRRVGEESSARHSFVTMVTLP